MKKRAGEGREGEPCAEVNEVEKDLKTRKHPQDKWQSGAAGLGGQTNEGPRDVVIYRAMRARREIETSKSKRQTSVKLQILNFKLQSEGCYPRINAKRREVKSF